MEIKINVPFTRGKAIQLKLEVNRLTYQSAVLKEQQLDNCNQSDSIRPKIFCIGRNKTGTTSLEKALADFGYKMGDQEQGEMLFKHYGNRNWDPIINFCHTAEAFQDVPFSWPFTWLVLHKEFPDAKYILTVRDTESWYRSLISFHAKLFTDGKRIPVKEDLLNAEYRYKGFIWELNRTRSPAPENDIYNKQILTDEFNRHNENVRQYFKNNPLFLEIDVSQPDSYIKLCNFLGQKPLYPEFPHLNKT
jgi:hypothetical protein